MCFNSRAAEERDTSKQQVSGLLFKAGAPEADAKAVDQGPTMKYRVRCSSPVRKEPTERKRLSFVVFCFEELIHQKHIIIVNRAATTDKPRHSND